MVKVTNKYRINFFDAVFLLKVHNENCKIC